jgi:hypothetical protein
LSWLEVGQVDNDWLNELLLPLRRRKWKQSWKHYVWKWKWLEGIGIIIIM